MNVWILLDEKPIFDIDLSSFGISLFFVDIDQFDVDKSPLVRLTPDYLSKMTYGRLFVTQFIDKDIDKILYLDCDVCAYNDVDSLYQLNDTNAYASVARDISIELFAKHELDRTKVKQYFNGGVILFNLCKIRNDNIDKKMIDVFFNPPEWLLKDACWHD